MKSSRGQIALPLIGLVMVFFLFVLLFIQWGKHSVYEMRAKLYADSVALSSSREQAEILNKLSMLNAQVNAYVPKASFFGTSWGVTSADRYAKYGKLRAEIETQIQSFTYRSIAVGEVVARINGATLAWPYQRNPNAKISTKIRPYLRPQRVQLAIGVPYGVVFRTVRNGFYLREWDNAKPNAQPHHTITWGLRYKDRTAFSRARLWHDVNPHSPVSNGGFPRPNDGFLRSLGVQSFYPQFNARLDYTSAWESLL